MACNENGLVRDGTGWNRQKKKINSDVVELIGSGKGLGSGIGNGIGHTYITNSDVVELIGSGKGLGSGIGNGIGHT